MSPVVGLLSRTPILDPFAEFDDWLLQIQFINPVDLKFLKFVKK
jgi:hypothetical protein